jgi:hypothetical protein
MKTSELTRAALDWAVAMCLGWKWKSEDGKIILARPINNKMRTLGLAYFHASKSWSTAGPIIERECIEISCIHTTGWTPDSWNARHPQRSYATGPTPLIAAMRCYVASKLGDEVEVPEELR